jgi:1-acyl-sn-glycerol-3-phosphate acyltransferase
MSFIRASVYYGNLIFLIIVIGSFMCPIFFLMEFLYEKVSRTNDFLRKKIYHFLAACYFIMLHCSGCRVFYQGPLITPEHTLYISNHRSKLDSLIIYLFILYYSEDIQVIVKKDLLYYPLFNVILYLIRSTYVKRNSQKDKEVLIKVAEESKKRQNSLLIFPEGNTFSIKSRDTSNVYALQNNAKPMHHVIYPRTKGFTILYLFGDFKRTGNFLIRYDNPPLLHDKHSYLDLFRRFPKEIYLNMEYGDINPNNLVDKFYEKDEKLNMPLFKENYQQFHIPMIFYFLYFINYFIFLYFYLHIPYFTQFLLVINFLAYILCISLA